MQQGSDIESSLKLSILTMVLSLALMHMPDSQTITSLSTSPAVRTTLGAIVRLNRLWEQSRTYWRKKLTNICWLIEHHHFRWVTALQNSWCAGNWGQRFLWQENMYPLSQMLRCWRDVTSRSKTNRRKILIDIMEQGTLHHYFLGVMSGLQDETLELKSRRKWHPDHIHGQYSRG